MAANDAIQWPGLEWCACGSMSSFIGSGLKSHGVCVELLVTVMSSALAIAPFVTDDAVELDESMMFRISGRFCVCMCSNTPNI